MIAALLLAAASYVAPLQPGIWSDVSVSRDSGDYDGLQLRIPDADARTVSIVICEGGCTPEFAAPIMRNGAGFTFDVAAPTVDRAGRAAGLPSRHVAARFDHDRLVVVWLHEDAVDVLRRRAQPLSSPGDRPVLVK